MLNKRGLSEIVVSLILIIVVIAAVSIVWVVVRGISDTQKEEVNLGKLTLDVGIDSIVVHNDTNCVDVKVKRDPGLGNLSSLKFMFYSENDSEEFTLNTTLIELETRFFNLCLARINVTNLTKISLAPIIKTESGKDIVGNNINTFNIKGSGHGGGGGSSGPGCTPDCQGRVCGVDPVCGTLDCGSCSSNQTCNAGVCVSNLIATCDLINSYWSDTNVSNGTLVNLFVNGTNCTDELVNFSIWEQDDVNDDFVTTILGNYSNASWIALWTYPGDDDVGNSDRTYYFTAFPLNNVTEFVSSNILNVSQTICVPDSNATTCGSWVCGNRTNNCGQFVDCGSCSGNNTCQSGICVSNLTCTDGDGDGYNQSAAGCGTADCNDNNAIEHPGQVWYNDLDHDGYGNGTTLTQCSRPANYNISSELITTVGDCNNNNASIHPGATETCDGVDNNCVGGIDEGGVCGSTNYYCDFDLDSYRSLAMSGTCFTFNCVPGGCSQVAGNDCNDFNNSIHPNALDTCNNVDDDCNALTPDGRNESWYNQVTSCGVGLCVRSGVLACANGVQNNTCVAGTPTTEICNGLDEDCNGVNDNGVLNTYYKDLDADTYGNATNTNLSCSAPLGYVSTNTDCNDNNAIEHPGQIWYNDLDHDGYGNGTTLTQCSRPANYNISSELTATVGDCNNNNASIHPGATETCDGVDNNCAGGIDEGGVCTNINYYCDNDSDTYRSLAVSGSCSTFNCVPGGCSQTIGNDCNDFNGSIHPNALELCNGVDDDCDGLPAITDDGTNESWYNQVTSCGVGLCARSGNLVCFNAAQVNTCTPGTPANCTSLGATCGNPSDTCGGSLNCGGCGGGFSCNATFQCQDITPPSITNVASSGITSNSATITWNTNENADSKVEYGLTVAYGTNTTLNSTLTLTHSQLVSGLSAITLYHYRVWSKDVAGNNNLSGDFTFTTNSIPDTNPPIISNGQPTSNLSAGTTNTTISLTTDENAICRYSTVANTLYSAMPNTFTTTGTTSHSTLVLGLQNGTNYNYYVRCNDTSNNTNTNDYAISFSVNASSPVCNLTNAYWSASSVSEGTQVTLTVQGNNCNGKILNLTVWEDDFSFGGEDSGDDPVNIEPVNAVFSGNTATTTWTSEYQSDGIFGGNPEYYFIATIVNNASANIKSNSTMSVSKSSAGGLTCASISDPSCTQIYDCGLLSGNKVYYLLMNDIVSNGTCFNIQNAGITLDLNNHTIVYGNLSSQDVFNGGFESGAGSSATGWNFTNAPHAFRGGGTFLYNGTMQPSVADGNYSLQFNIGAGTSSGEYVSSQNITLYPGVSYTVYGFRYTTEDVGGSLSCAVTTCGDVNATIEIPELGLKFSQSVVTSRGFKWYGGPYSSTLPLPFNVSQITNVTVKVGIEGADVNNATNNGRVVYIDEVHLKPAMYYGVLAPYNGASAVYKARYPNDPYSPNLNTNLTLKNGKIIQGSGTSEHSHAVFLVIGDYANLSNLNITTSDLGIQSDPIKFWDSASYAKIYQNILCSNAKFTKSRDSIPINVISAESGAGNNQIYNNQILCSKQRGIYMPTQNSSIHNNFINITSFYTNNFGIMDPGIGSSVYNNTIINNYGRGIHVSTNNTQVYNNYIDVKWGPNQEYAIQALGGAYGIQIEAYNVSKEGHNIQVYNNTVLAKSEPGVDDSVALRFTSPVGTNISVYNNNFTAVTSRADRIASVVSLGGGAATNIRFYNNSFNTNNYFLYLTNVANVIFDSNTFNLLSNPTNLETIAYSTSNSTNNTLVNSTFGSGVDAENVLYTNQVNEHFVDWYLNLIVQNSSSVLQGANVEIRDLGNNIVFNGTTDAQGKIFTELREYGRYSPIGNSTSFRTNYTAHNVTVYFAGYQTQSQFVTMNQTRNITMQLALQGDVTPPSITNVASSGITSTSATITWLTNENTDGKVEYGLNTAYGTNTTLNATLSLTHIQLISGLTNGTLYHFRVWAKDSAGNNNLSGDFTFTTGSAGGITCEATGGGNCYYVQNTNPNCNDNGQGNFTNPFCTVNHGVDTIGAGDILYIRNGTYDEVAGMGCVAGNDCGTLHVGGKHGNASNPIIIRGYPGDTRPIIKGGPTRYAATVTDSSYVTIEDLEITGGYRGLTITPNTDHLTIRNNHIHDTTGTTGGNNQGGVVILFATKNSVNNLLIENNVIHDNLDVGDTGGCGNCNGVHVYSLYNSIIRNNIIYNQGAGIYLKGEVEEDSDVNISIYNNTIYNTFGRGIQYGGQGGVNNVNIYNNIVYNFGGDIGIGPKEDYPETGSPGTMRNIKIYNNLVDGYGSGGCIVNHNEANVDVKNNIIYNCGDQTGCASGSYSIELAKIGYQPVTGFTSDYNIIYDPNNNLRACWNDTGYNFIQWKALLNQDQHSIDANPQWVNEPSANYTLQSNSPAIDNGTFIPGFHCQFNDSTPGQTNCVHWCGLRPDIGAVEYCGNQTQPPDINPPILSNGLPNFNLSAGTTNTTISLNTDENAICRYSTVANTLYSAMTNTFTTTGTTSHSTLVTGLQNGTNYNYYVRCNDTSNNTNTNDYTISFGINPTGSQPSGILTSIHNSPSNGYYVINGSSFIYNVTLTCNGGSCGSVTGTLDPQTTKDNNELKSEVFSDGRVEFSKWNENSLNIDPSSLIKGNEKNIDLVWYNDTKNNALEYEIILKSKPTLNSITLNIKTEGLEFLYQSPLNEKYDDYVNCNETDCWNGSVIVDHRPENVVGSYAVYAKGKSGDYSQIGGKNYGTGKVMHIYRPKAIDDNGNEVWGSLNIDEKKGVLEMTFPQSLFDKASYPLTIDPTFGYNVVGGSGPLYGYFNPIVMTYNGYTALAGDTITKFSMYGNLTAGGRNAEVAAYSIVAGLPANRLGNAVQFNAPPTDTGGWSDTNNVSLVMTAGTKYGIGFVYVTPSDVGKYYDDGNNGDDYISNTAGALPATWGASSSDNTRWSIYATYSLGSIPFKGAVPTNSGTPFYTVSQNPQQCANMQNGNSCNFVWNVTANGSLFQYEFYSTFNSSNSNVSSINSSKINISIVSAPPPPCNLTSAIWNASNVTEGQQVTLTVQGTNCGGQSLNFSVWEYDTFPGIDDPVAIEPANTTFLGNTATTTWKSEWQGESLPEVDPPEYYFIATLVNNASESIQSNDPKLNVWRDQTPPLITNVAAGGIQANSATIIWDTNELADSQIEYGLNSSYGTNTTLDSNLVVSHSQLLSSLTNNTLYHYRVWSKDSAGNVNISGDYNFTTGSAGGAICEAVLPGKCYYVSIAGNDNNNGSFNFPFRTVHKGVQVSATGDYVYIRSGTYQELSGVGCYAGNDCGTLYLSGKNGVSSRPITIKGYPNETMPVIRGSVGGYASVIDASNYVTIDGLEITGGWRGLTISSGNNIIIRNSVFHHNNQNTGGNNQYGIGILFNGPNSVNNAILENNIIYENWESPGSDNNNGIHVYSSTNLTIRNNTIFNQTNGIYIKGQTVANNGLNNYTYIYGNRVHDTAAFGIEVHGQGSTYNSYVYDNILYDSDPNDGYNAPGIATSYGSGDGESYNTYYFNNIIDCNGYSGSGMTERFSGINTTLYNNIFADCGNGVNYCWNDPSNGCVSGTNCNADIGVRFGMCGVPETSYNFTSNYNDFFGGTATFYWHPTDSNYDLTQWRTITGNDKNSSTINPLFVNRANKNYSLQFGSPAVDAGVFVPGLHCARADDNSTNPYPTSDTSCRHWCGLRPDMGAVEYCGPLPDVTPPVITNVAAGAINSTSSTITWNTDENADGKVEYGLTTTYGTNTTLNSTLSLTHIQTISGLSSNKLYHFRVWSKDSVGNNNLSGDYNFTTASGVGNFITGNVVNTSGSPIYNVTVEAWQGDSLINQTQTNVFGDYNLTGLNLGTQYTIRTYHFYNVTPIADPNLCFDDSVIYNGHIPKTLNATVPATNVDFSLSNIPVKGVDYFTSSGFWTTFWSQNSFFQGYPLRKGDIITSRDPQGVLNGMTVNCWASGRGWYSLQSWGEDIDIPGDQGAVNNDNISFYINNHSANIVSGTNVWDMLSHNTDISSN